MIKKQFENCPEFEAGDATHLREILHPINDKIAISYSIAHAWIAPKSSSLPHSLTSSEVYYILSGQGLIYINQEKVKLKKGDTVFVPAHARQYVTNTGSIPLVFLCIVEPYWQEAGENIDLERLE